MLDANEIFPMLVCFGPAILFGGYMLIEHGVRGRKIDEHPRCRKCNYDLYRRPVGQTRCPECGTRLSGWKNIRAGTFVKRRWSITCGAAMALLIVSGFGAMLVRGIIRNPYGYKPTTWLRTDWRKGDALAFNELFRRTMRGDVSGRTLNRVLDDSLTDLSAPTVPANAADLQLIWRRSRARGNVDDERWKSFLKYQMGAWPSIQTTVVRGEPLTVFPLRPGQALGIAPSYRIKSPPFLGQVSEHVHRHNEHFPDIDSLAAISDGPSTVVFEVTLTEHDVEGKKKTYTYDVSIGYQLQPATGR